jgi:hypothetical protein
MCVRRTGALSVVVCLVLLATYGATALAATQYVLKHPAREHCKAHYSRKTKLVKQRQHGHNIKVREFLCVYITPKEAPAAFVAPAPIASPPATPDPPTPIPTVATPATPEPPVIPAPVGPLRTTTALSVSAPEGCNIASYGGILSENYCYYTLSATVNTPNGTLISPEVTFGFENPANESEIGTVKYFHSFRIEVSLGRAQGKVIGTTVSVPGVGVVEEASGEEPWSVAAVFQETSLYLGSYSETKTVNWW